MNNKPHTEREERNSKPMSEWSTEDWMAAFENTNPVETPKGKTAVTFYIPEGKTFGKTFLDSIWDYFDCEWGDDLIKFILKKNPKQIQEAIDNTFPEKDA